MLTPHSKSTTSSFVQTVTTFFALYFTTLFSTDSYAAARASPFRPANSYIAQNPIVPGTRSEYQAGMHGRGARGPGSGEQPRRDIGGMRDSRPPVGMGATAQCGACMT
jgi:hypothetical protein